MKEKSNNSLENELQDVELSENQKERTEDLLHEAQTQVERKFEAERQEDKVICKFIYTSDTIWHSDRTDSDTGDVLPCGGTVRFHGDNDHDRRPDCR